MSGDEIIALIASVFLLMSTWSSWLHTGARLESYHHSKESYAIIWVTLLAAAAILFAILRTWASWDVRDSWLYTSFYLVMGLGAVGLALVFIDWTGLSLRDDVLERGNRAAAIAIAGAILGHTIAFAGANVGDGPGWWVVIFCAGLANGSLLLSWIALDRFARIGDAITIDRNDAAAWRTAGWFVSGGIVFGRGAAGDWHGVDGAIVDFTQVAIGGLVLFGAVLVVEALLRPSGGRRHSLAFGIVPAAAYLCGAIVYVMTRHPW